MQIVIKPLGQGVQHPCESAMFMFKSSTLLRAHLNVTCLLGMVMVQGGGALGKHNFRWRQTGFSTSSGIEGDAFIVTF